VATIIPDTSNELFQLAIELVNQSSRNIFLTGKAGTGKTTFLKYIRENCSKQMAVVAPTGVAAINAGGVTIHSFFQLPFSPFVPEAKNFSKDNDEVVNKHSLLSRLRITGEKKKVLEQLELLIIDEISMVRCDTMDAIDAVLRHMRKRPYDRFGGVQVLFIGDMFQLPPVIKEPEWRLLADHYGGPYFFNSKVIQEEPPVYIEFNKIYRQSEELFIRVLNQVRNNQLDQEGMSILEKRFQPSFRRHKQDGYIVLTTHNERAREINRYELQNLEGKQFSYKAEIKDEFPENAYPADEILSLKVGAQVMFIKNDSERTKRYFNGKIGTVTKLEEDKITVQCRDEAEEIEVGSETWENIRYTINKTSRVMDESVLGSFMQYPLRLAWAITIHKSQGLTFEKAIIDAGEAFAPGQVYVALSRCTSLDGLVLQSKIRPGSLFTDERIIRFSENCLSAGQLQQEFAVARRKYHEKLLLAAFDFSAILLVAKELEEFLLQHTSSFNPEAFTWITELLNKLDQAQMTALKFHVWLKAQFQQPVLPEENSSLQTKTRDGAAHFGKEIQQMIEILQQSPAVTDSRLHAKEFNESVKEVFAELSQKGFLLKDFDGKFDGENWHKRKKAFVLPPFSINAYAGTAEKKTQSEHPALYHQLRKLRDAICAKKDAPIYMVAGSKTLEEMAAYLPQTPSELEQITGFGKAKVETYGQQFLDIIQDYCSQNQLESRIGEKAPKKKQKKDSPAKPPTRAESFRLFKEGMALADIAKARSLTPQTIETHLAYYVERGEIKIEDLVSADKILLIEPAIKDLNGGSITQVKEKLGDKVGFGEIRLVIAWSSFKNSILPEP
jgi:hypothetical protein